MNYRTVKTLKYLLGNSFVTKNVKTNKEIGKDVIDFTNFSGVCRKL